MTPTIIIEVIGWFAALFILVAYGLLSVGRLTANSPLYQWMNVVGAIGFIINSGWNEALPSAALNDEQIAMSGEHGARLPPGQSRSAHGRA